MFLLLNISLFKRKLRYNLTPPVLSPLTVVDGLGRVNMWKRIWKTFLTGVELGLTDGLTVDN